MRHVSACLRFQNGAKPLSATVSSLASRHHYSMQKAKWVGFTHLADNQKPVIEKKRLIASFFSYHSLSVQRIEIRQEHLFVFSASSLRNSIVFHEPLTILSTLLLQFTFSKAVCPVYLFTYVFIIFTSPHSSSYLYPCSWQHLWWDPAGSHRF